MVTDLKKCRAQELTAANCIAPDLCEKMSRQFRHWPWTSFSSQMKKIFTVAPPVNIQNDCIMFPRLRNYHDVTSLSTNSYVYIPVWFFTKSMMVSVAVSKLGCSGLVFVVLGTKINVSYCREELLLKRLLPAIRSIAEIRLCSSPAGQCTCSWH